MLVIKPIQEKQLQRILVSACGGTYDPDSFAYAAYECDSNNETVLYIIGVCQFSISRESGVINCLHTIPGIEDDEALKIMARAAMNFLFRCAVPTVCMQEGAAQPALSASLGFRSGTDDSLRIDLEKFYEAPCRYTTE